MPPTQLFANAPGLARPKQGLANYAQLREAVQKTLLRGRERIEHEKVLTYWQTGKHIHDHLLFHKDRAGYGREVIARLSKDLEINDSLLWRTLQFARKFPILATWRESSKRGLLSWSHYRALIAVPDDEERTRLAAQAARLDWSSDQLEAKIQSRSREEKNSRPFAHRSDGSRPGASPASFKPKLGTPYVYQIKDTQLDFGFSVTSGLSDGELKKFREGDLVRLKGRELVKIKATAADLYTYKAWVERVIDADTQWMRVHLGYDIWVRQKLRLRGIDAPELDTPQGRAAKRFVEEKLRPFYFSNYKTLNVKQKTLTITTTKPDKFDRYLSDVWIPASPTLINLNQLLLDRGLARIKTDYSEDDWSLENWGRF